MPRLPLTLLALAPAILPAASLSLREAADRALLKNLGLAITREEVGKADDAIDIAKAAFDEVIRLETGLAQSRTAGADYSPRGPRADSWNNTAAVSKKFETGAVVTLDTTFAPTRVTGRTISPEYATSAGFSVSQPLLRGGGRIVNLAPLARARLNLERSRQNLRIAAADLLAATSTAYRNLAAARELVGLRESALKSSESLLAEIRIRRRPEIGTAIEQDELQAAADVASRRVDLAEASRSLGAAADALRLLLGDAPELAPDSPPPLVEPLPALAPDAPEFKSFITAVDAFNPEAELGEIDIRDAETVLGAARENDSPTLDLVAGARTLGRDDSPFGAIEGLRHEHGQELSAGLRLSIPLGLREADATLRAARRSREQARIRLADTRRRLGFDARAVWRDLTTARQRLAAAEAGLALQHRAYENERSKLKAGASTINDVLLAAVRLDRARLDRLSASLDCATADIRRARLDGHILTRLGYSWTDIDDQAGSGPDKTDRTPF